MNLKGFIRSVFVSLALCSCVADPSPEGYRVPEFGSITVGEETPGSVEFKCQVSSMAQVAEYGLYFTTGSATKAAPDADWTKVQGTQSAEDAFSVRINDLLGGATYSCRLFISNGRVERLSEPLSYAAPDNGSGAPPMVLRVEPSTDGLVCLPVRGEVKCVVDWGDGSKEAFIGTYGAGSLASGCITHTYVLPDATSGATSYYEPAYMQEPPEFVVSISGRVPALSSTVMTDCSCIRAVLDWGETGLEDMTSAFKGCGALEEIAAPGQATFANVESFRSAFKGTALRTLPPNLFESATGTRELNETFMDCTFLTSLPEVLLSPLTGLERMVSTFAGCSSLTAIPAPFFDSNRSLNAMEGVFMNCSALAGESPYTETGGARIHLYERSLRPDLFAPIDRTYLCFFGCLNLSDYDKIPQNWKKP